MEKYKLDKNCIIFGMISSLTPEKNHKIVVELLPMIENSNIKLLIVGDGPLQESLTNLVVSSNLEEIITFCGRQENIVEFLSVIDVFLLPSLSEGLPMAMLEAMSCEKPVIATDVGGNSEIIAEGVSGFLVPPKDIKAMAEKFAFFYHNRKLGKVMGQKGREHVVKSFSVQEMTRKYEKLYPELFYYRA